MSKVVVDDALKARLNGLSEQLTFMDESGNVLGHFVPSLPRPDEDEPIVPLPQDQCPYTSEELAEMRRAKGGMSLKDFWKIMESSCVSGN